MFTVSAKMNDVRAKRIAATEEVFDAGLWHDLGFKSVIKVAEFELLGDVLKFSLEIEGLLGGWVAPEEEKSDAFGGVWYKAPLL